MKTLFTFFIFSLLAFSSKAQWIELDPGVDDLLYDVYAITPDTVVVVGANGTILKTTDGGETWMQKPSETTQPLRKVQFPTPDIGYVIGNSGTVLKTIDGGESWTIIDIEETANLYGLSCVDENLIFIISLAAGPVRTLLKSEDGGDTWVNHTLEQFNYDDIQFLNNQTGYSSDSSGIIYTEDGGTTWQVLGGIAPFQFLDENIGFYYSGGLYKTVDGGGEFDQVSNGLWPDLADMYAVNDNNIWGILGVLLDGDGSSRGVLKISSSNSDNYTEDIWYDNNPEIDMSSIHFADENNGYIVGIKNGSPKIWKNGTGLNTMETKETEKNNKIKVYPNPASKEINIAFDDSFSGIISLSDLTGKQVYSSALTNKHNTTMNVENLPKGTYILSVKSKQGNFSQKILIN